MDVDPLPPQEMTRNPIFTEVNELQKSLVADLNICRGSGGLKKKETRFDKKGNTSSRISLIKD